MTAEVAAIRAGVALAIGAVIIGCGSAVQTPATVDRPSVSVVADGVSVRLTLERDATSPALPLEAIVVVHNVGPRPIRWRADGCSLVAAVTIAAAGILPAQAPPRDRAATFVARITDGAEAPGPTVTLASESAVGRRTCQIDHGFAELAPGVRLTERAVWPATTSAGAPIAPGTYRVTGSFPMLTLAAPLVPAEFRADRDLRSIDTELALEVTHDGPKRLSAENAVTALLDATPLDGLVRNGDVTAADASLRFADGAWELRVRLPSGQVAIGRVAGSGEGRPRLDVRP